MFLHLNEKAVFGQIKGYNGLHTGLGTSFVMYLHLKGKAVLGQIKGLLSIPFMYYLHACAKKHVTSTMQFKFSYVRGRMKLILMVQCKTTF